MNLNKYTEKAQEALQTSQAMAGRLGHAEILPEHLLSALLQQPDGIVPAVLGKMQIDARAMALQVQDLLVAGVGKDGLTFHDIGCRFLPSSAI